MQFVIPLRKIDEEKRLVVGRAVQEVPDRSKEILDYETAKPAFEEWSKSFEQATGGLSKGNIRVMHNPKIVAGKVVEMSFNDQDKAIDIVAKIVDDNEWKKVVEGVYTGFSVGGSYSKKWQDGELTRYTPKVSEVSLVDRPCIPTCTIIELHKADGSVQEIMIDAMASEPRTFSQIPLPRTFSQIKLPEAPRTFGELMKSDENSYGAYARRGAKRGAAWGAAGGGAVGLAAGAALGGSGKEKALLAGGGAAIGAIGGAARGAWNGAKAKFWYGPKKKKSAEASISKSDQGGDLEKGILSTVGRKLGVGRAAGMEAMMRAAHRTSGKVRDKMASAGLKASDGAMREAAKSGESSVIQRMKGIGAALQAEKDVKLRHGRRITQSINDARNSFNNRASKKMKTAAGAAVSTGIIGGSAYAAYKASRRKKED